MDQPDPKKEYHHLALWSAAALTASVTVALLYLFYYYFKHSSWFPQEWTRLIDRYPTLVFVACGLVFWVVFGMLFYKRGSFADQPPTMDGWDTRPESQRHNSRPRSIQTKRGMLQPIEVDLQYARRICTGDLFLGPQTISFVSYFDQNATQAHAKKAIAGQFGPLGMLLYNFVTNSSPAKRKQRIEEARAQMQGLSLQAQIEQNQYSFVHNIEEITKINKSSWTGSQIHIADTKYVILHIESDDWQILESWCIKHEIETEGF